MCNSVENQGEQYPFHLLASWAYAQREGGEICTSCGKAAEYIQEHYINIFQIQRMWSVGFERRKAVNIAWNVARDEQVQGVYCCAGMTRHCWECLLKQVRGVNPFLAMIMGTVRPSVKNGWVFGHLLRSAEDDGESFLIPTEIATLSEIVSAMKKKGVDIRFPVERKIGENRVMRDIEGSL